MCCIAFLTLSIPVIIIYKTGGNLWMPGPKYKEFYKGSLLFLFLLYMADFITFLSTFTHASYSKGTKVAILCTVPISGLFFSLVQYCVKSWRDKKCIIDRQCCLQSILSLGFFMIVTYTILSVLPILLLFFIHPVNTAIITIYPVAATIVLCRWLFSNRDSSFFIMFAKIYCPCYVIMSLSMLLGIPCKNDTGFGYTKDSSYSDFYTTYYWNFSCIPKRLDKESRRTDWWYYI